MSLLVSFIVFVTVLVAGKNEDGTNQISMIIYFFIITYLNFVHLSIKSSLLYPVQSVISSGSEGSEEMIRFLHCTDSDSECK